MIFKACLLSMDGKLQIELSWVNFRMNLSAKFFSNSDCMSMMQCYEEKNLEVLRYHKPYRLNKICVYRNVMMFQ